MPQVARQDHACIYFKKSRLHVYSYKPSGIPQLENWLIDCNWQSSHSMAEIQKNLLKQVTAFLLVDLRMHPQKMLADVAHIQAHVGNVIVLGLVDHTVRDQSVLSASVSALVNPEHISPMGLELLLTSLCDKKNAHQDGLPLSAQMMLREELYFDRLQHALVVAERHHCLTGILLISIDQQAMLDALEDEQMRDVLLSQVALQISSAIRNSDSLAWLENDTFAVLLEDLHDEIMVSQIAKNIQQGFERDLHLNEKTFSMSISIGGHLCDFQETNGLALHNQAVIALQRAQQNGGKGLWFYLQEMNFKAMARQNIVNSLAKATQDDEFVLQYQPIHSGKGLVLRGVESQLRWQHKSAGLLSPEIFSNLLQSSGLIIEVGEIWIKKACQQIHQWQSEGCWSGLNQLLLDITEKQLRHGDLTNILIQYLGRYQVSAEQIVLMFDEKVVLKNLTEIRKVNKIIPAICIGVRLKDFSKGYSSLSYLKELDVDCLSLDNSFFQHLHVDHIETSIVKIIIDVAHTLGIEVMATGADSQFKLDKMKVLGCDRITGDYLSASMDGEGWAVYGRTQI